MSLLARNTEIEHTMSVTIKLLNENEGISPLSLRPLPCSLGVFGCLCQTALVECIRIIELICLFDSDGVTPD